VWIDCPICKEAGRLCESFSGNSWSGCQLVSRSRRPRHCRRAVLTRRHRLPLLTVNHLLAVRPPPVILPLRPAAQHPPVVVLVSCLAGLFCCHLRCICYFLFIPVYGLFSALAYKFFWFAEYIDVSQNRLSAATLSKAYI